MGNRRQCLICGKALAERTSTHQHPYLFIDSGLPDVHLIGVRTFRCKSGHVAAEIPALDQLLALLARDVVRKPSALSGSEVRFLRKRLGKRAVDFSKEIGIEPETLSRIENEKQSASESTDKLIRLYFAISSGDRLLLDVVRRSASELMSSWTRMPSPTRIVVTAKASGWEAAAA